MSSEPENHTPLFPPLASIDKVKNPLTTLLKKLEQMLSDLNYYGIRPGVAKYLRESHQAISLLGPQVHAAQAVIQLYRMRFYSTAHTLALALLRPPSDPRNSKYRELATTLPNGLEVFGLQGLDSPKELVVHGVISLNTDTELVIKNLHDEGVTRIPIANLGTGPDEWVVLPVSDGILTPKEEGV